MRGLSACLTIKGSESGFAARNNDAERRMSLSDPQQSTTMGVKLIKLG